jgi:hypothetical protein
MHAPEIDRFLEYSRQYPLIEDPACLARLTDIFGLLSELETQGEDEMRSIWIEVYRGPIEDFGSYKEYRKEGLVSSKQEFTQLWLSYYPDHSKWYDLKALRYDGHLYFHVDQELILSTSGGKKALRDVERDKIFLEWLYDRIREIISRIKENTAAYNDYIREKLPHQKRYGRILRKDYWDISPEEKAHFEKNLPSEMIDILAKIVEQSTTDKPLPVLKSMTSGDFFRYCELGYEANSCFKEEKRKLSPKEKYLSMADGRDCGLRYLEENSEEEFIQWFEHERFGGHPWEIFRGGNSTHISLFVSRSQTGWQLTLSGSSSVRVVETVKMACVLYTYHIPFKLMESREIYRMITGTDYIGIVPETILPRYCHSHFPKEDQIIDFMHLDWELKTDIITKTYWYPEKEVKPKRNNESYGRKNVKPLQGI